MSEIGFEYIQSEEKKEDVQIDPRRTMLRHLLETVMRDSHETLNSCNAKIQVCFSTILQEVANSRTLATQIQNTSDNVTAALTEIEEQLTTTREALHYALVFMLTEFSIACGDPNYGHTHASQLSSLELPLDRASVCRPWFISGGESERMLAGLDEEEKQ